MKILHIDPFSGVSGDMFLGALIDLGVDARALRAQIKSLGFKGIDIRTRSVSRGSINGIKLDVIEKDRKKKGGHTDLKKILSRIRASRIKDEAKRLACDIFEAIGDAEAKVHGKSKRDLHLHEVGEADSIVDITGAAIAVSSLGVDKIYSGEISVGRGLIETDAGSMPIPAPATIELLKGLPVRYSDEPHELTTPTGAAILKTIVDSFSQPPPIEIKRIGYGAGERQLESRPNLLRAVLGDTKVSYESDEVVVFEANVDDMVPVSFEYLFDSLFAAGALDVYTTPVLMKKSRPAILLTVLAEKDLEDKISSIIFKETTTLGIRTRNQLRRKLKRTISSVRTPFGMVHIKSADGSGLKKPKIMPEYEDCKRIARSKGLALMEVYEEAKKAYEKAKR
ncbi:MAG: nickel pincer cofactor biosynthesis protein LarC [Candidatus Omnitrophica bacterium]|nr:nickel pincer cofactor biosynthesis protein LarC [Candidatus Omnitrophota bacterium]